MTIAHAEQWLESLRRESAARLVECPAENIEAYLARMPWYPPPAEDDESCVWDVLMWRSLRTRIRDESIRLRAIGEGRR